ncbi:MAG TPA: hypothetical protein VGM88_34685 [Kofleriaceae bacterium]|jgi:hypothetical protein
MANEGSDTVRFATRGALILAFTGIFGGLLLSVILLVKGISSRDFLTIRMMLSSIAIFVATSFGALGFALFLIKADGAFRAQIVDPNAKTTQLETTAPGLVVFLCATVIMYFALKMELNVGVDSFDSAKPPIHLPVSPPKAAEQAPAPLGGDLGGGQ